MESCWSSSTRRGRSEAVARRVEIGIDDGVAPHRDACQWSPMKRLHRADLYGWSRFDEARDIDFHSVLWKRSGGNVVVDPLPLTEHDRRHLEQLGGAAWIVVTNSDHVRETTALAGATGAQVAGPRAEQASFPIACHRLIGEGDELRPGFGVRA